MKLSKTALLDRHAPHAADRPLLGRLLDLSDLADRTGRAQSSHFLDPRQQALATALLRAAGRPLTLWGGYEGAERRIALLLPDFEEAEPFGVALVEAATATGGLTHRDYLGALMGLGIERELIGDILVRPDGAQILALPAAVPILLDQFAGAGRARLTVQELPLSALALSQEQPRSVRESVASLRLDSIAAAGFHLSRKDTAELIRAGRLLVDGLPCEKPDRPLAEGATLTVRGKGRLRLESVEGTTRKGRTAVTLLVWK